MLFVVNAQVVLPKEFLASIPQPTSALPVLDQADIPWPLNDMAVHLITAQTDGIPLDRRTGQPRMGATADLSVRCASPASLTHVRFLAEVALAAGLRRRENPGTLVPGSHCAAWEAGSAENQLRELWQAWVALRPQRRGDATTRQFPCPQTGCHRFSCQFGARSTGPS